MLNRTMQRRILEELATAYPGIARVRPTQGETLQELQANLFYLAQHELVEVNSTLLMNGERSFATPGITAKGLDFLADDGGLSAILGVVTVKLHDDTIRSLLIDKIETAKGDNSVKSKLIDKVKGLPADALSTVVTKSLDAALGATPNLLPLLTNILLPG
ncbi:hypothetical protein [Mesorhizobium amorphae]|uniref:hypothetical protein n=1 Tax=Mesorhizobium amorphae TaxID=71433 RepID=UPI00118407EE|nr:hypothetical protein [Mesorhizobium amorphae]